MTFCIGCIYAPPGAGKTYERCRREKELLESRKVRLYDTDNILPFLSTYPKGLAQLDFQSACAKAASEFVGHIHQIRNAACLTNSLDIALALLNSGTRVCTVLIDEEERRQRLLRRDGSLRSYEPVQLAAGRIFGDWDSAFNFILGGFHGNQI